MVTFGTAVRDFYGNYVQFNGRASRSQFWWAFLYQFIVVSVFSGLAFICSGGSQQGFGYWFFMVLNYIFSLINFIPSWAVAWRRMHDSGRGGGWVFVCFVPLIGWLWFLILMLLPSQPEANRFGNVPNR